jgi:transcriptional regulator with XRE-family HTH domain/tetratricopeptide (TPR) repeat protein
VTHSEKQRISHLGQQSLQFGALLKTLRHRYGLKQLDILAQLSGWTQTTYSRLESGELAPAFDQLPALYSALYQAGIELTPYDRRQFVTLARERIEAKRSRQEHRTEREWDELRLTLARAEPKTEKQEDRVSLLKPSSSSTFLRETRHLIGREDWLRSVLALLDDALPKKLVMLQGPVGIGKSSELHRLASHLLSIEVPRTRIILCDLPATEHNVEPESALDIFLATILAEVGPPGSVMPIASLSMRITFALEALKQTSQPTLLLLDNAEHLLDTRGRLAPCWEQFLVQFLHSQHRATLFMATKEWHGWPGRDGQFIAEITVPLLMLQDSVALLQRLGLESIPIEYLQAISERVAGIPLCLEWVARLAQNPWELDEWWDLSSKLERDEQNRPNTITQRIIQLLEEPTLLGEHLATHLTPLLQSILDNHLSKEALHVLEHLSVVTVPLGEAALQQFCPRPGLLKELRDTSLLTVAIGRVQVLPMVAALVKKQLSPQQRQLLEEQMILALTYWIDDGRMSNSEAGAIISELATLYLKHYRLLEAAELLIRYGWLSFNQGYALHLTRIATQAMERFDWHTTHENECGGLLLHYHLSPFVGQAIDIQKRWRDYKHIQEITIAGNVRLQPLTEIHIIHHLLLCDLNIFHFEEAQALLDASSQRFASLQSSHLELQLAFLEEQAFLFGRWSEALEEKGKLQEAKIHREKTISYYRQCNSLLFAHLKSEDTDLKKSLLKKRLTLSLNNLCYQLNRIGRYEEALQMVEQCIALKEQGYTQFGALAAAYGEKSQILASLGRFREALLFDDKAITEIQRFARLGHSASQEEVWIYHVNRGCLYLRVGRVDEAEQLLKEALPNIDPRRSVYQMFAKDALEEIRQWRLQVPSSHHQLDWRWIERYRTLDAYDAYWWWAQSGPFTEEEHLQWDQRYRPDMDEGTKEQLGTLISQTRQRELAAAVAEQREPHLCYPALDVEKVRTHITGLLQLDAEINQKEPNALVRRFYHGTIQEEVNFLRLIEATSEGNTERFWELTQLLNPIPTKDEMNVALAGVSQVLKQGLSDPDTTEVSQHLIHLLHENLHLSLDLLSDEEETQTSQKEHSSLFQPLHLVSAQTAKRFFEAILHESGDAEWQVIVDPKTSGPRVETGLRQLFLPDEALSLERIQHYLAHELAGHVARAVAGEMSLLGLLGINTKGYMPTEEGLALYQERHVAQLHGHTFDDSVVWMGTLAVGLACGVVTPPQTFLSLYNFFEVFHLLSRLVEHFDKDRETAQEKARRAALITCLRTYRGVPDLEKAGICYTKDVVYLRGLRLIEEAATRDEVILDQLAVGKIALELLPDVQELGIVPPQQTLRKLAFASDLDTYILTFEASKPHSLKDA